MNAVPWLCRMIVYLFVLAYLGALALLVIGFFGLFGSPSGPLAGVFLIPLGMPWVLLGGSFPDLLLPAVGVFAPLINLALLIAALQWLESRAQAAGFRDPNHRSKR